MKLVLVILSALTLAACGSGATPDPNATPKPVVVSKACAQSMQAVTDALTDLNSRLSVGLTYAAYGDKVGGIRVAYDRIQVKDLDAACLTLVGKPEEDAYNAYVRALSTWKTCIATSAGCDSPAYKTDMQDEWKTAGDLIAKVKASLP